MPLQYRNRKDDLYTVFQGTTKTGKPRYYVSKSDYSDAGDPVEELPDDFEVFESPANGSVSVRRRKPTRILATERELIAQLVLKLTDYSVEHTIIDGDNIVVYTPDRAPIAAMESIAKVFGLSKNLFDFSPANTQFSAVLKFTLLPNGQGSKAGQRVFLTQRFCFRGSVDDWMEIGKPGTLERLAKQFIPTLGTDDFYELF